jgi:hypothetical protein
MEFYAEEKMERKHPMLRRMIVTCMWQRGDHPAAPEEVMRAGEEREGTTVTGKWCSIATALDIMKMSFVTIGATVAIAMLDLWTNF